MMKKRKEESKRWAWWNSCHRIWTKVVGRGYCL